VPISVRYPTSIVLLCCLLAGAAPAEAQFDTATVLGTVKDSTGGFVPGATVTLTNLETGVAAVKISDQNGSFEFVTVRVGRYKVTAELDGFAVALAPDFAVQVGARQRVDLTLSPGQLSETIEVSGAATRLETDSSQRGQVVNAEQIVELPLGSREYSGLVLLSPGVRLSTLNTGSATPREGSFNINGLRSTFNNFLLDGIDNNAYGTSNQGFSNQVMQPSPDAVAEFKVVTNNMSAEYGRSAGATINAAYKSGTNRFRGSAWEFYRDTALNATGFFKPVNGVKPALERDQYGFTFGGPLVKNRAFFFSDLEGFRQTRKNVSFATIPNATQRQGVLAVDVRHPQTGVVYPAGSAIPMTPFARQVLAGLPNPTVAGTANNFSDLPEQTNATDKGAGKIDIQLSSRLSMFGRYGHRVVDIVDQPTLPLPSGGDGNGTTYVTNKQFVTGFTWAPSGTSLLEGRFGWSRTDGGKNPVALGQPSAFDQFGITGLPTDPRVAGGLPSQLINGYTNLGRQATNPQWQFPSVFNPKINYTFVTGRHSLKAGYEFQHIQTEVQDINPLYGRDAYNGQFSRPAGAAANNLFNLADFMFGMRSQYALSNILVVNLRQNMHFGYLQDDFRLSDKLTLNVGLRYEYATPQWERDNVLTNFDPVGRRMISASDGSIAERALIDPDRNNFGPRLGFAYTATPRTVVRGGYGISYIHFHRAGAANVLAINGPQVINAVANQANPLLPEFRTTQQGYPTDFTDASKFNQLNANITHMPKDYQSSRVQSYYISAQRELGANMILDVAYVGNRADGLLLLANFNEAAPNNSAGSLSLQARRPIQEFADITYAFNGGKSRYNSLQVKYEYRMRRGLMLLNSFTWSNAKDNGAGALEGPNGNAPAPQSFRDLDDSFGTSAYDQPFNNTTSLVWDLPFGNGRKFMSNATGLVDALLGGWTISGISTVNSGEPVMLRYTPLASFQVSGIQQDFRGANTYRPNVNGSPYGDKNSVTNYLNPANVTIPTDPSQPFGNAAPNNVRGPGFWNLDMVAAKEFRLPFGDDTRIQFRLEAFNALNRTNFRAPNGNRSSPAFGTITSTYDARQLQLGVKVSF
jgi:Carboxypeptidase regulatory-like domain/TonB-dependent Receptor Plug Domain